MKVRIKFTKHGAMKFIGHLDIMRYFQKAMRRADVDIKYSEGFSPHQIMSFAAPLGVGLTSNGEYMDIEVSSTQDSKTMIKRINDVMAEGTEVVEYKRLDDTSKNAMSLVAAADYTVRFREHAKPEDLDSWFQELEAFYNQEQLVILKKTKRSQREVDIKPLIYDLHREGDAVFMKLSSGSTDNLKPELVLLSFYQRKDSIMPEFGFQIQREEIYADVSQEEGTRQLIPLKDFGEDIE